MKKENKNKENDIKRGIEMENKENNFSLDSIEISTWFKKALDEFKNDSHDGKTFDEETKRMESLLNKDFTKLVKSNNSSSGGIVSLTFTFCPKKHVIKFATTMVHRSDIRTNSSGSILGSEYTHSNGEYTYDIPEALMNEYNIIVCPYTDADFSEMILENEKSNVVAFTDKDGVLIEIKADKDTYTVLYNGTVMVAECRKPSEPIPSTSPYACVYHGHLYALDDMNEEKDEEDEESDNTSWYDLLGNLCYGPVYPLKNPTYPLNDRARLTGKYNLYITRYIGSPSSAPTDSSSASTTSVTQLLMKYVFISNDVKIFRGAKTSEEIEIKKTEMKEFIDCVRMMSGVNYGITRETYVIAEILLRQLITDDITSDIFTYYTNECLGELQRLLKHPKLLSNYTPETISAELYNSLGKATKDIKDNQKWYDVLAKPDVIKILDTIIASIHLGQVIGSDIHELIIG